MAQLKVTQDTFFALQRDCACGYSSEDMMLALAMSQFVDESGEVAAAIGVLEGLSKAPSSLDMHFDKSVCHRCQVFPNICCWVVR